MARKDPAAVSLGRRGGKATAEKLTVEERTESARRAAQARWSRQKAQIEGNLAQVRENLAKLQKPARKKKAPKEG